MGTQAALVYGNPVTVFALIEMYRDSTNMPTMFPQLKLNPPPAFQPQRPFESPNVVLSSGALGFVKFLSQPLMLLYVMPPNR